MEIKNLYSMYTDRSTYLVVDPVNRCSDILPNHLVRNDHIPTLDSICLTRNFFRTTIARKTREEAAYTILFTLTISYDSMLRDLPCVFWVIIKEVNQCSKHKHLRKVIEGVEDKQS